MYRRNKTNCPKPDFVTIDGQLMYGPIEADIVQCPFSGELKVSWGGTDYGPSGFVVEKEMLRS